MVQAQLQHILEWINSLGFLGVIVFMAIYVLAAVLIIPASPLTLGAGVIFGVIKGSIIVSVGATLGAIAAFLLGRYLLRDWVNQQISKRPKFKALDQAVAKEGWLIVGLARLSPLFPFVFLNYAFALTKISFRDYTLASWLGMLPGTVMYVYLGSLLGDIATLGTGTSTKTPLEWGLYLLGLLATLGVTVYTTKIARQALTTIS